MHQIFIINDDCRQKILPVQPENASEKVLFHLIRAETKNSTSRFFKNLTINKNDYSGPKLIPTSIMDFGLLNWFEDADHVVHMAVLLILSRLLKVVSYT